MGAGDRRERERERAQGLSVPFHRPPLLPLAGAPRRAAAPLEQRARATVGPLRAHQLTRTSLRARSFVEDIEINDLRNRYLLTKGPTQQQILADTGAAVLTKGVWYPDKTMATEKDPALYLHITAETADKLEAGVRAVQALIDQELNLLDTRRGPPRGEDQARDSGYGQRVRPLPLSLPLSLWTCSSAQTDTPLCFARLAAQVAGGEGHDRARAVAQLQPARQDGRTRRASTSLLEPAPSVTSH